MPSISGYNKIVLKAGYTEGGAEHEEGILDTAGTPGMNVVMSDLAESQQRQHYAAGSSDYVGTGTDTTTVKSPVKVLKEDVFQSKTINDAYAAADNAFIHIAKPGDVLQVLVASGQTVAKTNGLSANSAGKWVVDAANPAVESMEDSGGALAADTHMRVRVL